MKNTVLDHGDATVVPNTAADDLSVTPPTILKVGDGVTREQLETAILASLPTSTV